MFLVRERPVIFTRSRPMDARNHGASHSALEQSITLKQAKKLVQCMANEQSSLLLSPPGVGRTDRVFQAAAEVGLAGRPLLGPQTAHEDVRSVTAVVGERSVFCPP